MTVFERIEDLRKSRKISQGKLEKELGFSNGSISKWKTSMPTPERLQKIADYFGVTVDYLMTGRDNVPEEKKKPYSDLKGIYLSYAQEAQDSGIDPDDIRLAIDTIKRLRGEK